MRMRTTVTAQRLPHRFYPPYGSLTRHHGQDRLQRATGGLLPARGEQTGSSSRTVDYQAESQSLQDELQSMPTMVSERPSTVHGLRAHILLTQSTARIADRKAESECPRTKGARY